MMPEIPGLYHRPAIIPGRSSVPPRFACQPLLQGRERFRALCPRLFGASGGHSAGRRGDPALGVLRLGGDQAQATPPAARADATPPPA